jgi:hypothetical protein
MRRGLMGWDADELPAGMLNARIARLREAMQRDGLDAFLIYTNFVRPSAVTYLTGFTPYWSDGLLLVEASGAPVFATALSKRVANWIRTTTPVADVINAPRPGAAVGARFAADSAAKRVGVLELDALPSGIFDDLTGAAPALALVDAGHLFSEIRRGVDDAERRLIARADDIARMALEHVDVARASDAGSVAGAVERQARLAGAEDVQVAVAHDLDTERRMLRASRVTPLADRFALRVSAGYKGSWVRRARTFARDVAGAEAVVRCHAGALGGGGLRRKLSARGRCVLAGDRPRGGRVRRVLRADGRTRPRRRSLDRRCADRCRWLNPATAHDPFQRKRMMFQFGRLSAAHKAIRFTLRRGLL